ncbi:hypothetical protein CYMTET_8141 [Cymbomonas tetramitiformis]|uniref:Uncharacterized protein n=1 Tax=Cymbomonas tetramitiformis TaxID=36881 RepID=A0AAE0GU99_9CHLO|nr:hypothetical protein CYMTET_8141 [Cymbomonas tetramitiformis]
MEAHKFVHNIYHLSENDVDRISCERYILDELLAAVKCGDDRLVRPNPSDSTSAVQEVLLDAGILPALSTILSPSAPASWCCKAGVAEVLAHLARGNAEIRAQIGAADFIPNLFPLLKEREATAAACEAFWILAFNSPSNIAIMLSGRKGHLLEELLQLIQREAATWRSKMWAAAALQNLAANYYSSASGYYEDGASITYSGANVRARLIQADALNCFVNLVSTASPCIDPLPSQATDTLEKAGMAAWAAAGRKPTSPLPDSRRNITTGDDWLENSKSAEALQNFLSDEISRHAVMEWFTGNHSEISPRLLQRLVTIAEQGTSDLPFYAGQRKTVAILLVRTFKQTGNFNSISENQCSIG